MKLSSSQAIAPRRIQTHALPAVLLLALPFALGCHPKLGADVVATVNGKAIHQAALDKMYAIALGDVQQKPSPDESEALRLQSLKEVIEEELIEQKAAKMNLTATDEEVDARISEMKAPYTDEAFAAKLKSQNWTMDDLRHDVHRALTTDKLLNKEINSKITVTDVDVANYYSQHKADFNIREPRYRLAQILVTSVPAPQAGNLQNSKATNDVEAKKKIQALKNRLDSGEDFGTIALNFSERPETATNGGDMGFIYESDMRSDPAVFAAVTKLKAGQMTDILPLVDPATHKVMGYQIYKLTSREAAGQRDLSDPVVMQGIRKQLQDGRSQLLKNAYFEMLHDQSKIENFYAEQIFKNQAK